MRVAYICADPGVPIFGHKGCSVHAQEVIGMFREHGHTVEVFASNFGGLNSNFAEGLSRTYVLSKQPSTAASRGERENALFKLNQVTPRLFHSAGPFDLIYERHSLWSYSAMEYARSAGILSVLEVNAPLIEEQSKYRELIHLRRARLIARRAFESASAVVAVSSPIAHYVERHAERNCRVLVVPNGVNPNRFPRGLSPTIPKERGTFTIGFVGSLKPWHGLSVLADAFALVHVRHPEARLLIVGHGPERTNFEQSLRKSDLLHAVHFTGAVPPQDVPGLLSSMDAAVAPYPEDSTHYFSPLKIYEYMAAGLPIVASNIGQIPEVIEDEVNGLLVTPGSVLQFARAIERLMMNHSLRDRLGNAARTNALRHHTWNNRLMRILDFVRCSREIVATDPSTLNTGTVLSINSRPRNELRSLKPGQAL